MREFTKVLVANRGEIAVRVIRTLRELGIGSVAVYSEADRGRLHTRVADEAYLIGPGPADQSYLCGERLVDAAVRAGAAAVHPGYGFLAENAAFARQVEEAGLVWIGPPPAAIELMGSKTRARTTMAAAGVPIIPGTTEPVATVEQVIALGAEVGYLFSSLNEGRLRSTMLTATLLNGVDSEGEAALRNTAEGADVYLQGLQLFGDRNTVGGFYYRGRSFLDEDPDAGLITPGKQRFARYGVMGNYLLLKRLDVVAGAALGWDRSPVRPAEVRFGGFFTEVDAQLMPAWIGVYRFDRVDPNRDEAGDATFAHTVSTTVRVDDHLYLTGEFQRRRLVDADRPWAIIANARFVF